MSGSDLNDSAPVAKACEDPPIPSIMRDFGITMTLYPLIVASLLRKTGTHLLRTMPYSRVLSDQSSGKARLFTVLCR